MKVLRMSAGLMSVAAVLALLVACSSEEQAADTATTTRPTITQSAAAVRRADPKGDAEPSSVDIVEVVASRSPEGLRLQTRLAAKPFVNQPTSDETGVYAVQIASGERIWTVMASSTLDGDEFTVAPLPPTEADPARDIAGTFSRNGWTATVPTSVLADAGELQLVFDAEYISIAKPGSTDTAPDAGSLVLP